MAGSRRRRSQRRDGAAGADTRHRRGEACLPAARGLTAGHAGLQRRAECRVHACNCVKRLVCLRNGTTLVDASDCCFNKWSTRFKSNTVREV